MLPWLIQRRPRCPPVFSSPAPYDFVGQPFTRGKTAQPLARLEGGGYSWPVLGCDGCYPSKVLRRLTALAHAPDVCKTENPTRDTTHRGTRLTAPSPVCRKRPFTTRTDRLRPNPPIPVAGVFGRQTAHHGQHWGIPPGQPSTSLLTGQGEHGLSHPTLEAVVVHELLEQFGIILD